MSILTNIFVSGYLPVYDTLYGTSIYVPDIRNINPNLFFLIFVVLRYTQYIPKPNRTLFKITFFSTTKIEFMLLDLFLFLFFISKKKNFIDDNQHEYI